MNISTEHVDGLTVTGKLAFGDPVQCQSSLIVGEEYALRFTKPKPNRWRRFWYWALLGWRWIDGAGWGTEG